MKRNIKVEQAEELLEKYYTGATNVEEERLLARFLSQPNLPSHFDAERAMFAYFKTGNEIKKYRMPRIAKWSVAVAAVSLFVLIVAIYKPSATSDFAYIDGYRITNRKEIRSLAQISFENISSQNNEVEIGLQTVNAGNAIDNQLEVFSQIEF